MIPHWEIEQPVRDCNPVDPATKTAHMKPCQTLTSDGVFACAGSGGSNGGPRFWAIISLRPLAGVTRCSRFTERGAQTGPDSWDDWAAQPKNGGCGSNGGAIEVASSTSIVRLLVQSASDEKPNGAEQVAA